MKTSLLRLCLVVSALFFSAAAARAEDLNAVRARMAERLPKLDALKASGAIGENNRGLVEVRGGSGDATSVVAEENRDRGTVYAQIAQKNGTSAEQVGRVRAKKIAESSAAGVWLQRDDGTWFKK